MPCSRYLLTGQAHFYSVGLIFYPEDSTSFHFIRRTRHGLNRRDDPRMFAGWTVPASWPLIQDATVRQWRDRDLSHGNPGRDSSGDPAETVNSV